LRRREKYLAMPGIEPSSLNYTSYSLVSIQTEFDKLNERSWSVKRTVRRIFDPKKEEVTWDWRKCRREALSLLLLVTYHYGDQIKDIEKAGHLASMGEQRNAHKIFLGKPME
jgi:hypothetical protein